MPAVPAAPAQTAASIARITELYADAQRCAESAGLVYVSPDEPGIRRERRGRGFGYRDSAGRPVDAAVKQRIVELAIPPAWSKVWICPQDDGHLLATGEDERGRKQYLYHPQWRAQRDLLNFYRLLLVADGLPPVREHVAAQLRRRTLDRDRVLACMVRIVDRCGVRIGSEVYAEENQSYGLTTLTRRHVAVAGTRVRFDFPAKSGRRACFELRDRAVARVVGELATQRRRRLFTVDGIALTADDVNSLLTRLTGERVTAKDFRTWRGTRTAFAQLQQAGDGDPAAAVLGAVDAAAEALGNTRAVAREHYVHPHLLDAFTAGTFARYLSAARPKARAGLDPDEQVLVAFLEQLLLHEYGG